LYIGDIDR